MKIHRVLASLVVLAIAFGISDASGQSYPNRPVRIIVPYPPSAALDAIARTVAQKLTDSFGQTFLVDNRPGASGTIGAAAVAKAPPDGYTLLFAPSVHIINGLVMKKMPYDPVMDFTPISQVGSAPLAVVVHPSTPVKDMREFLQLKENNFALNWAIAAIGSADHLSAETFRLRLGVPLNLVPYKGLGPAISDSLGGHVGGMTAPVISVLGHIREGKLRAIAVTSAARNVGLPDVPTVAESALPGFEISTWYGLWGPRGLSREMATSLAIDVQKGLATPDVAQKFPPSGFQPIGSTPEQFARFVNDEVAKYRAIVREARVSVDSL